jgi:hypothetical protein
MNRRTSVFEELFAFLHFEVLCVPSCTILCTKYLFSPPLQEGGGVFNCLLLVHSAALLCYLRTYATEFIYLGGLIWDSLPTILENLPPVVVSS